MKQLVNILGMAGIGLATAVAGRALRVPADEGAVGVAGAARGGGPMASVSDLEQWARTLRGAGQRGRAELEREARAVDPSFGRSAGRASAPCDDATQFVGVEVEWGQLDGDAAREAAVHVTYASPSFQGERCEEHWVGFFDAEPGTGAMRLRGSVERLLSHCEASGAAGVRAGFAADGGAGLVLQTERAHAACGAAARGGAFERQAYRIERGALVAM